MDEVLLKTRELLFKFGEEYKVDIWDKLPREEKIESMLSGLQKYDLESGVDNANLERQVKGIHRAIRKYYYKLKASAMYIISKPGFIESIDLYCYTLN